MDAKTKDRVARLLDHARSMLRLAEEIIEESSDARGQLNQVLRGSPLEGPPPLLPGGLKKAEPTKSLRTADPTPKAEEKVSAFHRRRTPRPDSLRGRIRATLPTDPAKAMSVEDVQAAFPKEKPEAVKKALFCMRYKHEVVAVADRFAAKPTVAERYAKFREEVVG